MVFLKSLYPPLPPIPDANVHNLLFNAPGQEKVPDYVVQVDGITGRKRSLFEFRDLVYNGATALASAVSVGGLELDGTRDIVGLYSHNCLDYIAIFNSLLALTVPIALLSAFSTPRELIHLLRSSKATVLFVEPALLPKALEAAKEVGLPESSVHILEGHVEGRKSFQDLTANVKQRGLQRVPPKPAKRSTLAYLIFSSGTSGLPKAVMCTHGNIWATIYMGIVAKMTDDKFLGVQPPKQIPTFLLFLPLHHAYGIYFSILRPFSVPTTTVLLPRWSVKTIMQLVPKYRVQYMPLIPSALHQLVNHPDFERTDWSSLAGIFSGAAYTPPALADSFTKRVKGVSHIVEGYGASEMGMSIARKCMPGCFGLAFGPGTTGILAPGVEARIVRPDGSDAEYDEPGELYVRGGGLSPGYFNNDKATEETFVDGWLRTGDTFKADKDGMLYFVDRAKDTLKVSGTQVSPTEIEEVIRSQPDKLVHDVCVAGVSGGRTADEKVPRAWIVLSGVGKQRGAEQALRAIDEWSKKNLSSYKWLRGGMEVVTEIPKNPTGKVLRRVLQEQYEQTHSSAKAKL